MNWLREDFLNTLSTTKLDRPPTGRIFQVLCRETSKYRVGTPQQEPTIDELLLLYVEAVQFTQRDDMGRLYFRSDYLPPYNELTAVHLGALEQYLQRKEYLPIEERI